MTGTELLNPDGRASMATIFLMVHHGLRRDVARLVAAVQGASDPARIAALREGWTGFSGVLHGHHEAEDSRMFPSMRAQAGEAIDQLAEDHRAIDPLLARIGDALGALPERRSEAAAGLVELAALLDGHLGREESVVIPIIRHASLDGLAMVPESEWPHMVEGFAWSAEGIAPDIVEIAFGALPEGIRSGMGVARAAHEASCERVWGGVSRTASRTGTPA